MRRRRLLASLSRQRLLNHGLNRELLELVRTSRSGEGLPGRICKMLKHGTSIAETHVLHCCAAQHDVKKLDVLLRMCALARLNLERSRARAAF